MQKLDLIRLKENTDRELKVARQENQPAHPDVYQDNKKVIEEFLKRANIIDKTIH